MRKNFKYKLIDKKNTYIDKSVEIGKNVVIYPNCFIKGNTKIDDGCVIYPNCYINNCIIGKNCSIFFSFLEDSVIKDNSSIGPYARIRPNSVIEQNCKIGNFVEVKNSCLKEGTKASHLAYIGDASIGKNCNIGCGAIFVNYNGKSKNKTTVGDNCFIGSNVNVIAPLKIDDNTYIASGSTLTKNTNKYDFVIARCKETIKENYSKKYFKEK